MSASECLFIRISIEIVVYNYRFRKFLSKVCNNLNIHDDKLNEYFEKVDDINEERQNRQKSLKAKTLEWIIERLNQKKKYKKKGHVKMKTLIMSYQQVFKTMTINDFDIKYIRKNH